MQEPVDPFGRDGQTSDPVRRSIYAGGLSEDALMAEMEAQVAAEAAALEAASRNGGGMRHLTPQQVAEQGYLREVTQAVSVAAAYFEDTLEFSPSVVLSAGSVSAQALGAMLTEAGFGEMMDAGNRVRVREVVEDDALAGQAVTSQVPRGWLAGVRGALRS